MKNQKRFLLVLVATVVAVMAERSTADGSPDKTAPPKRTKMDCGGYRAGMELASKSAGIKMTMKAGSWGTIPAALRTLPPGAELCGATEDYQVVVVSPLWGKDMEAHYAPLLAKVGCQPLTCEATGRATLCKCKGNDTRGTIQTDSDVEAFFLIFRGAPGKK